MNRVVLAEVYDKTRLHTSEGEYIVVDDDFHMSKKGWWYFELIKFGRIHKIGTVIKCIK